MFTALGTGGEREITYNKKRFASFDQVISAIETLLDRKARKNGVVRHLASTLKHTGTCSYTYPRNRFGQHAGFSCRRVAHEDVFRLWLAADAESSQFLVTRLNATESLCIAISKSKQRAKATRGTHGKLQGAPHAIAGANGKLKRHFRNSAVTFDLAVSAIAYALGQTKASVFQSAYRSLEENDGRLVTIRNGRFVFRIEFATTSYKLVDTTGVVSFLSTNDNSHRAYQRVRRFLKRGLNRLRKKEQDRRQLVLAARKQRRLEQVLFRNCA